MVDKTTTAFLPAGWKWGRPQSTSRKINDQKKFLGCATAPAKQAQPPGGGHPPSTTPSCFPKSAWCPRRPFPANFVLACVRHHPGDEGPWTFQWVFMLTNCRFSGAFPSGPGQVEMRAEVFFGAWVPQETDFVQGIRKSSLAAD